MKKYIGKRKSTLIIPIVLLSCFICSCSGSKEIQSSLNDPSIKIDGSHQDWGTSLGYIKNDNIAFGFKNDKENLYIGIVTSDRSKIMKILSMGFTVWLESDKDKIGIKYPLKSDPEEMGEMGMQPNRQEAQDPAERIRNISLKRNELQVINKDDLPLYTEQADKGPDFIAKLKYDMDQLVYELKIPLTNNKLAERVFDKETKEVEINFVTGSSERNFMPEKTGGFGGMRPPQNPGGMRGERPAGERMNLEPLDYSFNLKLAK